MPEDAPLLLACSSCLVTGSVPVEDPVRLRDVARHFFVTHTECTTSIDLDGRELRAWAVRTG